MDDNGKKTSLKRILTSFGSGIACVYLAIIAGFGAKIATGLVKGLLIGTTVFLSIGAFAAIIVGIFFVLDYFNDFC